MNNKTLLFCLPAILGAPLFGAHASGKETPEDDGEKTGRPNVLFLLTDDPKFTPRTWTGSCGAAWHSPRPT